jgi:cytoskeletal protein CcmA (bactofilin family)
MAKNNEEGGVQPGREGVISIIGPGMSVTGDCEAEGTLRIEGNVKGTVSAGKAVVVGKEGVVDGDVLTQDAVVGGRVTGSIVAESRLELQATCVVEGEIKAKRIKLDEGGRVNGMVHIGDVPSQARAGSYSREGGRTGPGEPPKKVEQASSAGPDQQAGKQDESDGS